MNIIEFIESLTTKFVLEVCGSAGATWGVLGILDVKNEETMEACRWSALTVGSLFFFRFVYQHYRLMIEMIF